MKRLILLPVAGFLFIAGAAVAAASPDLVTSAKSALDDSVAALADLAAPGASPSPTPDPESTDDTDATDDRNNERDLKFVGVAPLLTEVLADLVDQGVISQEQADQIVAALTDEAEARRAELEAQREQMQQMWEQIRGFLEDGVISADEIEQLPADNPITQLEGILDDGQITVDELRSIGGGLPFFTGPSGRDLPGGAHHGPHFWFGPGAPAVPEDSGGSDGSESDSSDSGSGANS